MRSFSVFILATLAALPVAPAASNARSLRTPVVPGLAPLESKGCYYYRGEQRCGNYCYWEVNGRRYCQQREFEAYPQADPLDEVLVNDPGPARRAGHAHSRRLIK